MRVWRLVLAFPLVLSACGESPKTTGTLTGKINFGGQNPALVKVELSGPAKSAIQAGADGSYSFPGLTAGTYLITASAPSADPATQVVTVTDGTTQLPDLMVAPYGSVAGAVALGGNSAGVIISVLGASPIATTDTAGAYTLAHVPTGKRTILATYPNFVPGVLVDLDVPYNGTANASLLTLSPAGSGSLATIKGKATLIDRTDASGTTVSIEGFPMTTATSADGSFAVENAPLGVISLHFKNGSFEATLPNVLSLPGTDGLLMGTSLQPLVPFDIPRSTKRSPRSTSTSNIYSANRKVFVTTESTGSAGQDIYRVNNITGESFTLEAGAAQPEITPDGSRVVYSFTDLEGNTAIKSVAVTGGTPTTVVADVDVRSLITPDGSRILYFVTNDMDQSELRSAVLATGASSDILATVTTAEATSAASSRASTIRTLIVTPDSQKVVLSGNGSLLSIPVSGGAATTITSLSGPLQWLSLTPSGTKALYYVASTQRPNAIALTASATPTPLGAQFNSPPLSYSPDEKFAIFYGNNTRSFYLSPVDGSAMIQLQTSSSLVLPFFNSDNTAVTWVQQSPVNQNNSTTTIKHMVLATKETTTVATGATNVSTNNVKTVAVLSPDAQTLYVNLGAKGSDLTAVKLSDNSTTVLSNRYDPSLGLLSLSPDGSKLLFPGIQNGSRALLSVAATGGTVTPQLYTFSGARVGWVSPTQFTVERSGTPAPFEFQDGIYVIDMQ